MTDQPNPTQPETLLDIVESHTYAHAKKADRDGLRARLEEERNDLDNSFGHGSWADGLTRDRIRLIDEKLAALPSPTRDGAEGVDARANAMLATMCAPAFTTAAAPPKPAPDAQMLEAAARIIHSGAFNKDTGSVHQRREALAKAVAVFALSAPAPDAMREARKTIGAFVSHVESGNLIPKDGYAMRLGRAFLSAHVPACLQKAQTIAAVPPADGAGDMRTVLENARLELVLAISFLERDAGSDRLQKTIAALIDRFHKADDAIRAARASPSPAVAAEPDDDWEARSERSYIDNTKVVAEPDWDKIASEFIPASTRSVAAEPVAWQPGQSIEDRARKLLEVELDADPAQPTFAAIRAISAALQGEATVIDALRAVWDDWVIANDESGVEEYQFKDVAPETVQIVQRALRGRLYASPPIKGDRIAFYTVLKKYIPQEPIDQAWQELKEAGLVK